MHGHPVQLSTCFIAAVEAQGTTCGDQMVNTKGVEVIAEGIDAVGNASMYGVVNGAIPTLVGVSADPADDTGKNVFELEGSGASATVAFGPFLRSQYPNDKTIAIAYQNLPGAVPISQAIQKSAQSSGFTVTMIPYSSTATDLIAQATQMEQAQITVPDCGFVDCPLMAKAMSEIGAKQAGPLGPAVDRPARRRPSRAVTCRSGSPARRPRTWPPPRTRASRRTTRRSRRTACRPRTRSTRSPASPSAACCSRTRS